MGQHKLCFQWHLSSSLFLLSCVPCRCSCCAAVAQAWTVQNNIKLICLIRGNVLILEISCLQDEPAVLPARVPHLLVNGAAGIAVGIATKIPPHNLREVVAGLKALIHDPNITIAQLMLHIPGPDFPTGAALLPMPLQRV